MKVFKFGGASVKNPEGIKNLLSLVRKSNDERLIVVVSAMGKTTNALDCLLCTSPSPRDAHESRMPSSA